MPPCQCRHGIAIPEGDLRQGFETAADGSVGAARSPGWVSRAIGTGRPARDYSKIKVPVLAISDAVDFDLSHLKPEQPQPRNDEERALLIAFGKATQAVFDRWSANLKRGVPDAKVVDMPGATALPVDDARSRRAARDPRLHRRRCRRGAERPVARERARGATCGGSIPAP